MRSKTQTIPGFMISGTHSSVGKTSVTLGMMRWFHRNGYKVRPFKVGPDYIDPAHHSLACEEPSYNLDTWMCGTDYTTRLFYDQTSTGDVALLEGMMGLYDGAYSKKAVGSSSEAARLLNLPVVLVIDGTAMARSAAAVVKGFETLETGLSFAGVVANNVSHPNHIKLIRQAIEHYTNVPFLGALPHENKLTIPHRHLGLHQAHEQTNRLYNAWADHLQNHLNLRSLVSRLKIKKNRKSLVASPTPRRWQSIRTLGSYTVGIARDAAFQFCYQDMQDLIRATGGTIRFFSPMKDRYLPEDADWIYYPGGYPELYSPALADNISMLKSVRSFKQKGKGILAECGGLMYLGKKLVTKEGTSFPMAGIFNFATTLKPASMTLGYRNMKGRIASESKGTIQVRGHEFHFSNFKSNRETPILTGRCPGKKETVQDGYRSQNTMATYSHLYWASSPKSFLNLMNHLLMGGTS